MDGRYFCDKGNARVDNGNNNVLELHDEGGKRCVIRRGFQASYYEATFKFKWDTSTGPGWVVRWRDPGNWLAISLTRGVLNKAQPHLYRRKDDGLVTNLATGSPAPSPECPPGPVPAASATCPRRPPNRGRWEHFRGRVHSILQRPIRNLRHSRCFPRGVRVLLGPIENRASPLVWRAWGARRDISACASRRGTQTHRPRSGEATDPSGRSATLPNCSMCPRPNRRCLMMLCIYAYSCCPWSSSSSARCTASPDRL